MTWRYLEHPGALAWDVQSRIQAPSVSKGAFLILGAGLGAENQRPKGPKENSRGQQASLGREWTLDHRETGNDLESI